MPHDPKSDPYIALRRFVETLGKGKTLRERVRELGWRRVKVMAVESDDGSEALKAAIDAMIAEDDK